MIHPLFTSVAVTVLSLSVLSGCADIHTQAEQGDADAQFRLSLMYVNGDGVPQDIEAATYWLHQAAEQGHADAQFTLGVLEQDVLEYISIQAEQGDADAQFNLGDRYQAGDGVPQDFVEAAAWYRKAAEQGDRTAQLALGEMYVNGDGVPQDGAEAYMWFTLAAEWGDDTQREKAAELRDLAATELTPADLSAAQLRGCELVKAHELYAPIFTYGVCAP